MSRHNDMQRTVDALAGLTGSSDEFTGDQKLAARTIIRRTYSFAVASVNANGNNVIVPNVSPSQRRMIANGRVLGAYFLPTVAATEHASNNANIDLVALLANGATGPVAARSNTNTVLAGGTGTLAPGVQVSVALSSNVANTRFTKGTVLAPTVTMNASGVAMGAGVIDVDVELEGAATDYPV